MTTSELVRLVLAWLGTYAVHSTLFLGGAWLLCALRPPRVNKNRERLWKLALVGGLFSASLQLGLGTQPLLGRIEWQPAPENRPDQQVAARQERTPASAAASPALCAAPDQPDQVASNQATPDLASLGSSTPHAENEPALEPAAAKTLRAPPASASTFSPALTVPAENAKPVLNRPELERTLRAAHAAAPNSSVGIVGTPASEGFLARIGRGLRGGAVSLARGWPRFVLLGWSAIGLLSLGGIVFSWSCLRRRMLGRQILSDGPLVAMLARLCAHARVEQHVRLSVSTRISSPFSTGLFYPEVCVPSAVVTELTVAQQEALLAHELAHLVRRDPAWFGTAFLIEKLFFFQPLNRLARREISDLAEVACDDWAVRWTGARLALASCLTEVAAWIVGEAPHAPALPGLAGQSSRLGLRVARLLDDRRSPANEPRAPWWPPVAAVALALAALAVPGVSASQAIARSTRVAKESTSTQIELPTALPVDAEADAPASAEETSADAPSDVLAARETLELELGLLQSEIDELHAELETHALRERFAGALERIDARMLALEHQHERVRELLAALTARNTTSSVPAPALAADPTDPSNLQRESQ